MIYMSLYIIPMLILLLGGVLKILKPKYPPAKKGFFMPGIILNISLRSEEHWNYSQRIGTTFMIALGFIDIILIIIMSMLCKNGAISSQILEKGSMYLGFASLAAVFVYVHVKTSRFFRDNIVKQ
ncbi:MAG: hypothetical protein ACK5LT_13110 [Lachnospirales bacterium]